jgi:hypothetical protein
MDLYPELMHVLLILAMVLEQAQDASHSQLKKVFLKLFDSNILMKMSFLHDNGVHAKAPDTYTFQSERGRFWRDLKRINFSLTEARICIVLEEVGYCAELKT